MASFNLITHSDSNSTLSPHSSSRSGSTHTNHDTRQSILQKWTIAWELKRHLRSRCELLFGEEFFKRRTWRRFNFTSYTQKADMFWASQPSRTTLHLDRFSGSVHVRSNLPSWEVTSCVACLCVPPCVVWVGPLNDSICFEQKGVNLSEPGFTTTSSQENMKKATYQLQRAQQSKVLGQWSYDNPGTRNDWWRSSSDFDDRVRSLQSVFKEECKPISKNSLNGG